MQSFHGLNTWEWGGLMNTAVLTDYWKSEFVSKTAHTGESNKYAKKEKSLKYETSIIYETNKVNEC